jgi:hypothetical protein
MRNTIEQALIQGVASISSVEVLPSEPTPALIPLESVRRRVESPEEAREAGWVQTARATEIPDGEISEMRTPLRYRTRPSCLRVAVPAASGR